MANGSLRFGRNAGELRSYRSRIAQQGAVNWRPRKSAVRTSPQKATMETFESPLRIRRRWDREAGFAA